jgi:hypothetical protein
MAYHRIDAAAINRLLRNPNGGVARDFQARGRRVLAAQQRMVGRSSGDLARDLRVRPLPAPYAPGVEIGSDLPQAIRHHRGHGVIRPVRAKALRFKPKGSTRFVFTMRVRAVKGNPFLTRSLRAARRGGI